jgi:TIR domain
MVLEGEQSRMSHDVFISHARKDKGIADAICEKLESAQLRCWIADRNISAGEDWTEVTRNAIASSRVMVLVLSENANAAPHIEREIAHAFYTGRMIIPLRVTETLPRRDFLFYLGNIRCFDAASPPVEQHLEAFAASIIGTVRGPTTTGKPVASEQPIKERLQFSDSWIGSLHASHYRAFELLKRAAIAIGVVAVGLLLWFAPWQTRDEDQVASENRQATLANRDAASDPRPQTTADIPPKPAYTYSRLGLWVPTNTGATTADRAPEGMPTSSLPQPATAAGPPGPDTDQEESAGTESLEDRDSGSASRPRLTNRSEMHRRKGRLRHHIRRVAASDESFAGHIKRGFQSVWRKIVDGNR